MRQTARGRTPALVVCPRWTEEREGYIMSIGSVVWYADSLWEDPVQVKVTGIEIGFNGKIVWVKAVTGEGEEICDYSNLFSVERPVVYR